MTSMRTMLVGHRRADPPAATITLGVAAALNGLGCDGRRLIEVDRLPSISEVAREAGLRRDTARAALEFHHGAGAVTFEGIEGKGRSLLVRVVPEAMRSRWADAGQRCRFPARLRELGLRPASMLLAGLILGQRAQDGVCRIGRRFLVERTGFAPRVLDTALASSVKAGAIKRWLAPAHPWPKLCTAEGPNLSKKPASGIRSPESCRSAVEAAGAQTCTQNVIDLHDSGSEPARKPHETRTIPANEFRSTRKPGFNPEPAAPAVETGTEQQQQQQTPTTAVTRPLDVGAVVEGWRVEHKHLDTFAPANPMHVAAVAVLLERLGWNQPADLAEGPAARRDARSRELRRLTMHDARRVTRWAGTADALATWILRAVAEHGPTNVCGYLRTASNSGDPGTLLHAEKKNAVGRAAETWSDYSPDTSRALVGERATQVEKLLAGTAIVTSTVDEPERQRLRAELKKLLAIGRRDAAKRVLLRLVGSDSSDVALARAVDGVLTLEQAKGLLAA